MINANEIGILTSNPSAVPSWFTWTMAGPEFGFVGTIDRCETLINTGRGLFAEVRVDEFETELLLDEADFQGIE